MNNQQHQLHGIMKISFLCLLFLHCRLFSVGQHFGAFIVSVSLILLLAFSIFLFTINSGVEILSTAPYSAQEKKKKEGSDYWYEKKKKLAVHYIHSSFKKKKDKSLYPEGQQKNDSVMSVSMCRPLFFFLFCAPVGVVNCQHSFCVWLSLKRERKKGSSLSFFFFTSF